MHGILHRPELLPSKGSSTEEKAQNFVQKGIKKKMKFFGRKSFFYLKHFPEWKKSNQEVWLPVIFGMLIIVVTVLVKELFKNCYLLFIFLIAAT